MIKIDQQATVNRKKQLEQYYNKHVLHDGKFICQHFEKCKESHAGSDYYEGQLHHVGSSFDISVDQKNFRVVVVGQEYGHEPSLVTSADREKTIKDCGVLEFRNRNPHMKGTTTLLRILHGLDIGGDKNGEWLETDKGRVHLFDTFALVNFLMCSATNGNTQGLATDIMKSNCNEHFLNVLKILQPTVLICQSKGFFKHVAEALNVTNHTDTLFNYKIDDFEGIGVCLSHPSSQMHPWGDNLSHSYLQEKVLPLLNEIRCKLGLALNIGDNVTHKTRPDVGIGEVTEIFGGNKVAAEFKASYEAPRYYCDKDYAVFTGISANSLEKKA